MSYDISIVLLQWALLTSITYAFPQFEVPYLTVIVGNKNTQPEKTKEPVGSNSIPEHVQCLTFIQLIFAIKRSASFGCEL